MSVDRATRKVQTSVLYLFPLALFSGITGVDLLYVLLFLTWLVDLYWVQRSVFVIDRIVVAIFVFFLLCMIPNLVNASWMSLDEFVIHHFRKVLLILVLIDVFRRGLQVERIVDVWIAAAALAVCLSFVGYYTRQEYFGEFVKRVGWAQYRAAGPGGWKPNMFANMLACVLPFGLFRTLSELKRSELWPSRRTCVYGTGTVLILAGITITYTRMVILTSVLAVLIAIPFLWGRSKRSKKYSAGWTILLMAIVGLTLWYAQSTELWQVRFSELYKDLPNLKQNRYIAFWTAALDHLWGRPIWLWLGAGTEQGMKALQGSLQQSLVILDQRSHAHNNLVQYLLDYGLVGVAGYLFLWGSILYQLAKSTFPEGFDWVQWAGITLVIVFNLNGMSEYNWGRSLSHYNVVFGLSIALHFSARGVGKKGFRVPFGLK